MDPTPKSCEKEMSSMSIDIMAEIKDRKESKKEKRERKKEKKEKKEKKDEQVKEEKEEKEQKEDEVSEADDLDHNEQNEHSDNEDASEDSENTNKDKIEIDLKALVPLSKKQQRLLKKGKLNMEKLAKKHPTPKAADEESEEKPAKSPFGVWIGNLSYDTSKEDITRFIVAKTSGYDDDSENDLVSIKEADITRVNLPKKANKSKGFAYVDLPSAKHVDSVVALSESNLNGRNLLIKNSSSFEGRPEGDAAKALLKNPPLRILFVGNLSFDTSEENLEEHFRHCGEIVRIRMATFQDSGKCKGFAFIDFKDESGPTTALKSKLAKKLINRPLRLEYGEDRSKRNPRKAEAETETGEISERTERPRQERTEPTETPHRERTKPSPRPMKRPMRDNDQLSKRMKSSVALATAQRASAAIVPSQGKKITFD